MCDFLIEYNFYQVMAETRNLFPSNEKLTRKPGARKSNRIKTPDFLQRLLQTLSTSRSSSTSATNVAQIPESEHPIIKTHKRCRPRRDF
jgi:hypothetical protein